MFLHKANDRGDPQPAVERNADVVASAALAVDTQANDRGDSHPAAHDKANSSGDPHPAATADALASSSAACDIAGDEEDADGADDGADADDAEDADGCGEDTNDGDEDADGADDGESADEVDEDVCEAEYPVQAAECRTTCTRHDDWLRRGPFLADLPWRVYMMRVRRTRKPYAADASYSELFFFDEHYTLSALYCQEVEYSFTTAIPRIVGTVCPQ